ncbi:MAG: helix-turn-helix domain-containing protein [Oscillospiraceae bacterium]|nr:helix-turn-helix domain-containing protein [Oscillospiraceae bacterium]
MLFSELLALISAKIPVKTVGVADSSDITDTALLDGVQDVFQNGVLYVGYYEQITALKLPAHCVLVLSKETEALENSGTDLALTEERRLFFLFNLAKALIGAPRGKGLYAELMDCAAQTKSVTAFANLAASRLGNSIVLLDRDFKVLSYSNIYPIDDPLWAQNIRQGYCSYEFISAVSDMEIVRNAPKTSEPIVLTCYASPLRKLSSKIFQGGRMIGFVIMLENENPVSPLHFELLRIVSECAGDVISRIAPYLLPDSTQYQRLIYEMVIGAPAEKLSPYIAKLDFPKYMCAIRISQSLDLGQKHLKEKIASRLKGLLPGTQLTYHDNGIAALLPLAETMGPSPEQLGLLVGFAEDEDLDIGLSGAFSRAEDFAAYYSQARRALELESRLCFGSRVCRFSDYAFFDLLGAVEKPQKLGSFCHPALGRLLAYDTENNTELLRTLETFLSCDRSVKQSSEKLFIHRNSLAYRLKRIFELTSIDLDDDSTRFLLEMSFRIRRYTENGQAASS